MINPVIPGYEKINTLFERDPETFKVGSRLRCPEWGLLSNWTISEKIDGTNIRLHLSPDDQLSVRGRTDKADPIPDLYQKVLEMVSIEKLASLRESYAKNKPVAITLYGEGYGAKIQGGGDYSKEKDFILFDVLIGDYFWLNDRQVDSVALFLGLKRVPVIDDCLTIEQIVSLVKQGFPSLLAEGRRQAEGVVARPAYTLYGPYRQRIIWKLKTKDF